MMEAPISTVSHHGIIYSSLLIIITEMTMKKSTTVHTHDPVKHDEVKHTIKLLATERHKFSALKRNSINTE